MPPSPSPIASPEASPARTPRTDLWHRALLTAALLAPLATLLGCGSSSNTTTINHLPPPNTEPNNCKATKTTSPAQPTPTQNLPGIAFNASVKAGALPVIGSSVQLYAAGTSGNGSVPTALLANPLTTDANGAFGVPASFTCPYSNSVLYLVARGGQAGSTGAPNAGIVLAAVLGPCTALANLPSVTITEATTAATAWAMAQLLAPGGNLGASSTNTLGLTLAAATADALIDITTGSGPGASFPVTGTAPLAKLNTLANALNACITSSGPSGTPCTQLYAATTSGSSAPTNTLDAALNAVLHPGNSVATLYTLGAASRAFTPALTAAPADWTLAATYSGGGLDGPASLSLDSQGNIWVVNYFNSASLFWNTGVPAFASGISGFNIRNSYGGAVDVTDTMWIANEQSPSTLNSALGSITLLNDTGASPAAYSSGGLDFPIAISFDTSGVAWVADYADSGVTLLDSSGNPLSGADGYTSTSLVFPVAIATDSKCNAYVAGQSSDTITRVLADGSAFTSFTVGDGPSGVAIDANDNVWSANYYGHSVGLVSSSGDVLSATGFTGGGINQPQGIAIDSAGTVWVANYRGNSLTQLSSASTATPGSALSPSTGWGPDALLNEPYAVAIDSSGNLWITNFGSNTLTEFIGLAAPVKTPLLGPVRTP